MDMTVTNVLAATDLVIVPVKIGGFEVEAADHSVYVIKAANITAAYNILVNRIKKVSDV